MMVNDWIALIGFLMGVCSFISGGVLWYNGSIEKRYAAQRDFAHLQRNQEQISQGINHVTDEMEDRFNSMNTELVQIKSLLVALLAKTGDSISSILKDR